MVDALSQETAVDAVAGLFGMFPLVWSTFAIIVSAGAVSSEAGVVADSILSKAVSRYAYILAKLSSRLITVIGVYLLVVLPPVFVIARNVPGDLTGVGMAWAVVLVSMALVLLTSLAVTLSAIFNRTLVVVVVVWFLWYVAGGIFALLGVDFLSPLLIVDSLPDVIQGDFAVGEELQVLTGFAVLSAVLVAMGVLYFSRKDV
jgi:hypothetical protein